MTASPEPEFRPLWPDQALARPDPPPVRTARDRARDPRRPDRFVQGVARPGLWVIRPPAPNGLAVLVIPGGGYEGLALDREGLDLARLFASAGAAAYVLEHRLPGEGWTEGHAAPLADASQALALIRAERTTPPQRIAVCGISAGGHLALLLAHAQAPAALAGLMLAYPLVAMRGPWAFARSRTALLGPDPDPQLVSRMSPLDLPWASAPPTLILQAIDDPIAPVGGALGLAARLSGAPVSHLRLLSRGGHGFIGRDPGLAADWTSALMRFLTHIPAPRREGRQVSDRLRSR